MPEPEYTQGPWAPMGNPYLTPEELWTPSKGALEVSPGLTMGSIHHTEPICRVFGYLLPVVANARLIAASPDTLESLIEVLPIAEGLLIRDCSESGEDMSPEEAAKFKRAHKAIAKAKGETPNV